MKDTIRTLHRIQIAIATVTTVVALVMCVAATTMAPSLGLAAGWCGLGAALNWMMCD